MSRGIAAAEAAGVLPAPPVARRPALSGKALAAALLLCLTLSACASWFPSAEGYRQLVDGWVGGTGQQLIEQWGLPDREHTDDTGWKTYQYDRKRSYTIPGGTATQQVKVNGTYVDVDVPQPDKTKTTWCLTTFYLNTTDVIKAVNFDGPDCTAYEKKAD
jgi:hypothetical protein